MQIKINQIVTTCSERCSQTDRTCRSSRPRYKYAATITLASVQYRITYKLCLPMHLIHTSQAPSYLTDIVTQTASASVTSRTRLRSGSSLRYEQPRTRLKRRKTSVFLRCTSCVEQSATVTSRTTVYLTLRHSNET